MDREGGGEVQILAGNMQYVNHNTLHVAIAA